MFKKPLAQALLALFAIATFAANAAAASKTYHENGKLQSETFYNDQSGQKEKANWYDSDGNLYAEEKFSDAKTKVVTFFGEKGSKKTEETVVDGKRVRVRTFYPSGKVMLDYPLKDEKIDGKFIEYREDGKISKEIDYRDGKEI